MDILTTLVRLEERFWRAAGDAAEYSASLAADALHVLPGWGVTPREPMLAAVEQAPPWVRFSIDHPQVVMLAGDAAALAYTAHAERKGEGAYAAAITSVYRRAGDGWELVVHQQTPLNVR